MRRSKSIGYADAATGSKAFNLKLSKLRVASVAAMLEKAGVDAGRIAVEGKGDTVQPFSGVEQNRGLHLHRSISRGSRDRFLNKKSTT